MEGLGDGSDKLVTVDVREGALTFGRVIDADSVGGRHEAHHGALTDDRRHYWVQGLDISMIWVLAGHSAGSRTGFRGDVGRRSGMKPDTVPI
jgi:selenium-binding protein 1